MQIVWNIPDVKVKRVNFVIYLCRLTFETALLFLLNRAKAVKILQIVISNTGTRQRIYMSDISLITLNLSLYRQYKMSFGRFIPESIIKSEMKRNFALLPAPLVLNFRGKYMLNILSAHMQTIIHDDSSGKNMERKYTIEHVIGYTSSVSVISTFPQGAIVDV